MSEQRTLLFQTLTSLHAGTGQPRGALKNPLLRESDTRWPVVSASTVKGALRKQMRDALYSQYQANDDWKSHANTDPQLLEIFGTKTDTAPPALVFGPARLLAFPLRSAHGIWGQITCPAALAQFAQSIGQPPPELPQPEKTQVFGSPESPFLIEKKVIILEDIELSFQGAWSEGLQWLAAQLPASSELQSSLANRLLLVSDLCFNLLVQSKTELFDFHSQPKQDKQAQPVEFLPAETLLYTQITSEPAPLQTLLSQCPEYIHLGAYQTLGKGLCAVIPLSKEKTDHV